MYTNTHETKCASYSSEYICNCCNIFQNIDSVNLLCNNFCTKLQLFMFEIFHRTNNQIPHNALPDDNVNITAGRALR